MSGVATVPCPVRLGSIRSSGVFAQLHLFTRERNLQRLEKLLKQGVDVDCVNNLGQTCLYCACLLGFTSVAELLLCYGADPNHRCDDRSTPLHAAVFSCDTRLLGKLLDAGGDLRLHDNQGRTPRDWADIGAQKNSVKMVGFIKSCMSVMKSVCESQSLREGRVTPTHKTPLHSPSLLDFLKPVSDLVLNKKVSSKYCVSDTVQCFGYGKVCVEKHGVSAGSLASIPLIADSELSQAEDEAMNSFPCGPFTTMTNYSWRGSRVTVKELQVDNTQRQSDQHAYLDLLITELSFCCQLFHPHLLQLMAVSSSNDLLQNRLVYERVYVGSLYTLFYQQRAEFPLLQVDEVLSLILQVCEALFFLHSRSLVLCSLSSHSVLMVHPGIAKITELGFMVPSNCSPPSTLPIPVMLYNWVAPEVIQRKSCTEKTDLYSVCALIQEFYTDAVPWGSVNPCWIRQAVDTGQALTADLSVPQPYYDLLLKGLKPRAQERTCTLQDLRYTLRSDLRELRNRSEGRPLLDRSSPHGCTDVRQYRDSEHSDEEQPVDQDIQDNIQMKQKCTIDTDKHLLHISLRDIQPNDWCHSHCTPSVKEEGVEEEKERKDVETESIFNHINSIVLNLKVSLVLLQQVESSLEVTKSMMMGNTCADIPQFDEQDGSNGQREKQVVVLEAVGPPSRYRPPSRYFKELEEDVCLKTTFCSDEEETYEFSEDEYSAEQDGRTRGGEYNGLHQSSVMSTPPEQLNHQWTGVVSAAVSRITRRIMNCATGKRMQSSVLEEVQEEQLLMDAKEDTHLEQLFKSFAAGIPSESGESTDYHTINYTFTSPKTMQNVKSQHMEVNDSDLDDAYSHVEPSSTFYTPQHHLENTKKEQLQTASSEDDPEVILEVCQPKMIQNEESTFKVCRFSPDAAELVTPYLHTIRCSSPAIRLERVGQNEVCYSTPCSLRTHLGQDHSAPYREVVSPLVPHVQSWIESSLWGDSESFSHTETHSNPIQSESDIHHSPTERRSYWDSGTPFVGNPEITIVNSGVPNCEERRSQQHEKAALLVVEKTEYKIGSDSEQDEELPNKQEKLRPNPNQTEFCCAASSTEETKSVIEESPMEAEAVSGQSVCAEQKSWEEVLEPRNTFEDAGTTNTPALGGRNGVWRQEITSLVPNHPEGFFWRTYPLKQDIPQDVPSMLRLCATLPSKLNRTPS